MRILLTSGLSLAIVRIAKVSMVAPVYYAYSFDFWDHLAASTNLTLRLRLPLRLLYPYPNPNSDHPDPTPNQVISPPSPSRSS